VGFFKKSKCILSVFDEKFGKESAHETVRDFEGNQSVLRPEKSLYDFVH